MFGRVSFCAAAWLALNIPSDAKAMFLAVFMF
jgi:hypothetical protein